MNDLSIQLVPLHTMLNIVLGVTVGYLLSLHGQPWVWRAILGVIQFGVLWDLAGLLWLGYRAVWPGESILTAGFSLAFLALIASGKSLVTRATHEERHVDAS
ncbi:hypothetical protein [Paraburkholderia dinghuensis]|uniref:Uncharacterized protein n=1 Tax=Paraburkholderia dinghuensis TaxID=2305225 RepID=A0A3N6PWB3_9BURK|nr:hypothetical protein [Paraburkholderia dinghuensis]RQH06640.1 hypothetical protein D1Y85_12265 [Paraburkholderia dinghuensis]